MIATSLQLRVDRVTYPKRVDISAAPATQTLLRNTMRGIKMKTCTKCHQEKELTEFYPDRTSHSSKGGYKPHCKICQKKQHKIYLQSEQGKAIVKAYSKTEISKARQNRYCQRHPERRKAKAAVFCAIQAGKLPRPDTLQCLCGNHKAEQYHHHRSYAKEHWLDVVPVCKKYHTNIHTNPELLEGDSK